MDRYIQGYIKWWTGQLVDSHVEQDDRYIGRQVHCGIGKPVKRWRDRSSYIQVDWRTDDHIYK